MSKKLLTEREIERYIERTLNGKYNRGYIRNPAKRDAFQKIINSNFLKRKGNENRITAFNRQWRKAQKINRMIYGKEMSIEERSEKSAKLVIENTFYKSSFMSNFHTGKNISIEESARNAETKTYLHRVSKFIEKYGESQISGDFLGIDRNLTMNEIMEMYIAGEIDKDTMNDAIEYFKTGVEYYQKQIGSD